MESGGGRVRFRVRVVPRASRTEVVGWLGGTLKIRVAAAPVGGAANDALVAFLAKRLGVPGSGVRILRGARRRSKEVEVAGTTPEQVRAALR